MIYDRYKGYIVQKIYSIYGVDTNGYSCAKKMNFDPYFVVYIQKSNSKHIIGLNVKLNTTKLPHENFCDLGLGKAKWF